MKILITGSAGFIGSHLTKILLEHGHTVVGIDNLITGSPNNIEDQSKNPNFTYVEADVAALDNSLKRDLESNGFSEIYHLACPTGVPNLVTLAEEMLLANSVGTKNILDIADKNRSKIIFTSSSEVYGDPLVFPQTESYPGNVDPAGLRSPYEEGKRFGESLLSMYVRKYDLDARIVRVFNTYGPNMSEDDQRVVPKMLNQIKEGQPLTVHGDGTQRRTFCYISDLIDGILLAMRKGETGGVYNLGSDDEITIHELAKLLLTEAESKSKIIFEPRPEHDHQARMPELTKIKRLGWRPKVSLNEGLKIILQDYSTVREEIPGKIS